MAEPIEVRTFSNVSMCRNCGKLEVALGNGSKLTACTRCKVAWYCSKSCQKQHWKEGGHKADCQPLKPLLREDSKMLQNSKPMKKTHSYYLRYHQLVLKIQGSAHTPSKAQEKEFADIVKQLREAAEWKEPDNWYALYSLGKIYFNGILVQKDTAIAFEWFERAAKLGHYKSFSLMALCLQQSADIKDTRANLLRVERLIQKSLDGEDNKDIRAQLVEVQISIGNIIIAADPRSTVALSEAIRWFRKAANQGSKDIWWDLGKNNLKLAILKMQEGIFAYEVKEALLEARSWLSEAASSGDKKTAEILASTNQHLTYFDEKVSAQVDDAAQFSNTATLQRRGATIESQINSHIEYLQKYQKLNIGKEVAIGEDDLQTMEEIGSFFGHLVKQKSGKDDFPHFELAVKGCYKLAKIYNDGNKTDECKKQLQIGAEFGDYRCYQSLSDFALNSIQPDVQPDLRKHVQWLHFAKFLITYGPVSPAKKVDGQNNIYLDLAEVYLRGKEFDLAERMCVEVERYGTGKVAEDAESFQKRIVEEAAKYYFEGNSHNSQKNFSKAKIWLQKVQTANSGEVEKRLETVEENSLVGSRVELVDLKNAVELNGSIGIVKDIKNKDNRYGVLIEGRDKGLLLKEANLLPLPELEEDIDPKDEKFIWRVTRAFYELCHFINLSGEERGVENLSYEDELVRNRFVTIHMTVAADGAYEYALVLLGHFAEEKWGITVMEAARALGILKYCDLSVGMQTAYCNALLDILDRCVEDDSLHALHAATNLYNNVKLEISPSSNQKFKQKLSNGYWQLALHYESVERFEDSLQLLEDLLEMNYVGQEDVVQVQNQIATVKYIWAISMYDATNITSVEGTDEKRHTQALRLLEEAASMGCGLAEDKIISVGEIKCELGIESLKSGNASRALEYFQLSARLGNSNAKYHLGLQHRQKGDLEQYRSCICEAVEAGNLDAQFEMGLLYEEERDLLNAEKSLSLGVKHGHEKAREKLVEIHRLLGFKYLNGDDEYCIVKNVKMAEKWLRHAADAGDSEASYTLLQLRDHNDKCVFPFHITEKFERAMQRLETITSMPRIMNRPKGKNFEDLVGKDKKELNAIQRLLKEVAKEGHSKAQFQLYKMFSMGTFAPKDLEQSRIYLSQASDGNDPDAQTELGLKCLQQDGCEYDPTRIMELFNSAAYRGSWRAMCELGHLHAKDGGNLQNLQKAIHWLNKAVKCKYDESTLRHLGEVQLKVSDIYTKEKDFNKAEHYAQSSVENLQNLDVEKLKKAREKACILQNYLGDGDLKIVENKLSSGESDYSHLDQAQIIFEKALRNAEEDEMRSSIQRKFVKVSSCLGDHHYSCDAFDEAAKCYRRALHICEPHTELNERLAISQLLGTRKRYLCKKSHTVEDLKFFEEQLIEGLLLLSKYPNEPSNENLEFNDNENVRSIQSWSDDLLRCIHISLGKVYMDGEMSTINKDYREAKKWFEKALQSTITKDDGLQDYINRVSRNLLVGTRVELFDVINRSELNGITGFICDEKDEKNRYPVQLLHAVETRIVKEDDFEIVPPPIYLDEKNFRVLDSAISADVRCGAKALEDNERDLHLNGYGTPDLLKKQQGVNSKKSSSGKKIKKRKLKMKEVEGDIVKNQAEFGSNIVEDAFLLELEEEERQEREEAVKRQQQKEKKKEKKREKKVLGASAITLTPSLRKRDQDEDAESDAEGDQDSEADMDEIRSETEDHILIDTSVEEKVPVETSKIVELMDTVGSCQPLDVLEPALKQHKDDLEGALSAAINLSSSSEAVEAKGKLSARPLGSFSLFDSSVLETRITGCTEDSFQEDHLSEGGNQIGVFEEASANGNGSDVEDCYVAVNDSNASPELPKSLKELSELLKIPFGEEKLNAIGIYTIHQLNVGDPMDLLYRSQIDLNTKRRRALSSWILQHNLHYPRPESEEKIEEIRGGKGFKNRKGVEKKHRYTLSQMISRDQGSGLSAVSSQQDHMGVKKDGVEMHVSLEEESETYQAHLRKNEPILKANRRQESEEKQSKDSMSAPLTSMPHDTPAATPGSGSSTSRGSTTATAALPNSGHKSPSTRGSGGIIGNSEGDAAGKFFIGGVSWQTTEAELREHFAKFGELQDVALMRHKYTGQPRGFGFVKFKDNSAASKVLSQKHILDGREVDVKRAVPRDRTSPSGASAPITKTGVTVTNTSGSGGAGSVRSPSSLDLPPPLEDARARDTTSMTVPRTRSLPNWGGDLIDPQPEKIHRNGSSSSKVVPLGISNEWSLPLEYDEAAAVNEATTLSKKNEQDALEEDETARAIVEKYIREAEDVSRVNDPARNGDCLVGCVLHHEDLLKRLGICSNTETLISKCIESNSMTGNVSPALVLRRRVVSQYQLTAYGDIISKLKVLEKQLAKCLNHKNGGSNDMMSIGTQEYDSDLLRMRVEKAQSEARAVERANSDESSEKHRQGTKLRIDADELSMALMTVDERVDEMKIGGVVMEEQELQALADLKGWNIEIRSLICIKSSSDFGHMATRTYRPSMRNDEESTPVETMHLLQEMRAKRTSHFQHIVTTANEAALQD